MKLSLFAVSALGLLACGTGAIEVPAAEPGSPVAVRIASDTLPAALLSTDLLNLKNHQTGACVTAPGFRTDSGFGMNAGTCDTRAIAGFVARRVESGNYRFQNYYSKKCLAITGESLDNGAHLVQTDCADATNQEFHTVEIYTGIYELRAAHSNKCLDLDAWGNLQQWDCWGGSNQRWRVQLAPSSELQVTHSATDLRRKCADTDGSSYVDGGKVMQWDCWGGQNQQWFPVRFEDGSYELKPRHSGLCLGITAAGLDNGVKAEQQTCDGSLRQRFALETARGGRTLRPLHSRKCLEREGVSNGTNGALLQQWACSGTTNQTWYFPGIAAF